MLTNPDVAGAALVISGSVRQSGDRLRIGVHLIDGASGCYLWSESVDGIATDVFALQELVAATVVKKLEPDDADRRGAPGPFSLSPISRRRICTCRVAIT